MNGFTFFSVDQSGEIFDDFVIAKDLWEADKIHGSNFREATHKKSMLRSELIIRTSFPFIPGTEEEVRFADDDPNEMIIVAHIGHSLSRCLCCLDFFHSEEVIHVEPFGDRGFDSACELCVEENGLVVYGTKAVSGGI